MRMQNQAANPTDIIHPSIHHEASFTKWAINRRKANNGNAVTKCNDTGRPLDSDHWKHFVQRNRRIPLLTIEPVLMLLLPSLLLTEHKLDHSEDGRVPQKGSNEYCDAMCI
jgi:hypothetical protein